MQVIIFAAFFYPFKGGYINNILELSQCLSQKNFQITIVTANICHCLKEEHIQNIRVIRLPCWNWKFLNYSYPIIKPNLTSWRLLSQLFKNKYDIINTQTRFFTTSFLGFLFAKLKRIPLIHTERGSCHTKTNSKIIGFINRLVDHTLGTLIARYANETIGVSESCCQFLKHLGAKNPIKIYNGIDVDFFSKTDSDLKNELSIAENSIVITFVGRIIFAKGAQDLINVFKKISEQIPNICLLIAGNGPHLNPLKKQTEDLNIEDKVIFLGERNKEEIKMILSITDIFVNPSYSEGLPTSVLEAGAMGLPIIATDVGGTKEIISSQELGILIPPQSPEAMEKNLQKLIQQENLRKKMGENAKKFIEEKFNWEIITNQYLNLFKKYV